MQSAVSSSPNELELRRLAKELTKTINGPVRLIGRVALESEYSFADVIRLGGLMISTANESFVNFVLKEKNREFLAKVFEALHDASAVEDYLYEKFTENPASAEEIKKALADVEKITSGPGWARRVLKDIWAEMLPKGKPGRPTQFVPERDGDDFLKLSAKLYPFCREFLSLRSDYPKKGASALFEFLASEYPAEASLAGKQVAVIDEVFADVYFQDLVKVESRARRLADAIAGKDIAGLAYTYSVQVGGTLRRARGESPEE